MRALLAENPGLTDIPDESGYTPLRWAGIRGQGEIGGFLVEAGADPNSVGADGGTPLHGAAHHDDGETMAVLLAAGGDISIRNRWGRTPLHVAARRGCLEVALVRPEAASLTRRQLDPYVGHYDLGDGFGFDVWRVGDRMRLMEFAPLHLPAPRHPFLSDLV